MRKAVQLGAAEHDPVDDGRMDQPVGKHQIAASQDGGEQPDVGQATGTEDERRGVSEKCGQLDLQLGMAGERPSHQSRGSGPSAEASERFRGTIEHARIPRQVEVVVTGEVQIVASVRRELAPAPRKDVQCSFQTVGLELPKQGSNPAFILH